MAEPQSEWTLEWYTTTGGSTPLQTFVERLIGRNKAEAIALIELLQKWGNQLRAPRSQALRNGLFELRGHEVRIFYIFQPGRQIVLLDGILKKQDRIPTAVLERVRQYQREIEEKAKKAQRG